MEITQVRIFPVDEEKLKAFVSIIFDDCFVVSDIKIIQGTSGLFISMPSKKRKNGTFRDIAHPLNNETRQKIEEKIIARYREILEESGGSPPPPMRELGAREGGHGDLTDSDIEATFLEEEEDRSWT
jgi:stage V sporulation protein G